MEIVLKRWVLFVPINVGLQIPFKAKLNQKFMTLPRELASK